MSPRTGQLELMLGTDAALERAAEWASRAWTWVEHLPAGATLSADDLRNAVGSPPGHGDAIGACLRNARKAGLIEAVGVVVSSRPERHRGLLRVWRRT